MIKGDLTGLFLFLRIANELLQIFYYEMRGGAIIGIENKQESLAMLYSFIKQKRVLLAALAAINVVTGSTVI